MKKTLFLFLLAGLFSCQSNDKHPLVSGELTKVADGFEFTEGPAADREGNVYFTDIPNNRIHIFTVDGEVKTFRENSGGANGLLFDRAGNLIACAGAERQLVSFGPGGQVTVLSGYFEGRRYNRPNDLWIDPMSGIYFTDPAYGMDVEDLEMTVEGVYYLARGSDSVVRVCNDLARPNGIIGTPDNKKLYITDHHGGMTWEYRLDGAGQLTDKREFAPVGCDGLTLDQEGHVYLTNIAGKSVDIYSAEGTLQISIPMPESPTNVCFGGKDRSTLFITAGTSLYTLDMRVKGW